VPHAIEIHDWTAGPALMVYNLRSRRLQDEQVLAIREKILGYQQRYPGRPVWLIGHSGGGAMALKELAALPEGCRIAGAVLLCPAMSPWFDLSPSLAHCERGIWNVRSWGDLLFLGIFTTLFGTVDGRHCPAAGACGFRRASIPEPAGPDAPGFFDMPYRLAMAGSGNLAGHFGCVRRQFVRQWIAPIVAGGREIAGNRREAAGDDASPTGPKE
jgi:pimeloyl-ACP methyl ester carboxylesterase